ncbi:MAG: hypothetical protein GY816_12240 [Cytophagales bacterium]|nr:hypothetical protein [Cytophagales bacterium]
MKNLTILIILALLVSCSPSDKSTKEEQNKEKAVELVALSTLAEDSLIVELEIPQENNTPQAKIQFEKKLQAFVSDPDTEPTNVRAEPGGEIVSKLPQENGYEVSISGVSDGWFLVSGIWSPDNDDGSYDEIRGFIHGSVLGMDTRNYGAEEIYLYAIADDDSETVVTIESEVRVTLKNTNSDGSWLQVRWIHDGKTDVGWIHRDMLCGSMVTNCS